MKLEYTKISCDNYITTKQVLKNEFKMSSRLILKLKKLKKIYLNDKFTYLDYKLISNDRVTVDFDFNEDNSNIISTKMDLDIIYEDDCFLIVNKPPFIPVHPSSYHPDDSLSNEVKYYFDKNNINKLIRPVNRLDRNTSGIVIFAKNEYVQECLINQMKENIFKKEYIAICEGYLDKKDDIINFPISRKEKSIIERKVSKNGENAITEYKVEKEFNNMSLLKIILKTGRTHQIRVHLSYIGHPIIGDDLYGNKSDLIKRQALHAKNIEFIHPITKKLMKFESPIPEDIKRLMNY